MIITKKPHRFGLNEMAGCSIMNNGMSQNERPYLEQARYVCQGGFGTSSLIC
jgi:hypothetical protein